MLDGIKVVDASSFLTGPFAAMMLADLGATVVKVEPPNGDGFRRFGRRHNGQGISFANTNRNKRSVVIDLREPSGREAFDQLLDEADVLFTNWRPATTTTVMGLGEATVRRHPRLIWVRITGFGSSGPMAEFPAFDSVIQAVTGLASTQGDEAAPTLVKSWVCDKVTAMFAAQAALAALVDRAATGAGRLIDVPMLDALAYFNFPDLMVERTVIAPEGGARAAARNEQLSATRPVPTSDGWILISPVGGQQIKRTLAALGCSDRAPELKAIADPAAFTIALYRIAGEVSPERSTAEWLTIFREHDVPAAPVLDLDGHLADPQVQHNGVYQVIDDPHLGPIRGARHPFGRAMSEARPFPLLGEHGAQVLGADGAAWGD